MTELNLETKTGGRAATDGNINGQYVLSVGEPKTAAPEGRKWTLLTDVARLETGHTPSRKKPEYWGGDVCWIGIKDATGNHGLTIQDTIQHTNELGIANSSARILPAETVCLSRTASVGYVIVMGKPMATSQDFVNWVCGPELNQHFLKYCLLAERESFLRFATGTSHQTIYFPEVKAFHLALPSRKEQDAIADTLGALDDKIEVNQRMNGTLEAMVQAVFRDWFVDFGPTRRRMAGASDPLAILGGLIQDPSQAHRIASLFPDAFDDENKPVGWKLGPLLNLCELKRGYDLPKRARRPGEVPVISSPGVSGWHDKAKVKGPGIVTGRYGTIGQVFNCESDFWPLNTTLYVRDFKGHSFWYVFHTLCDLDYEKYSDKAAVPGVNRNALHTEMVSLPPVPLIEAFDGFAQGFMTKVEANKRESETLATTRDLLLPKLMSGEIRLATVKSKEVMKEIEPKSAFATDLFGDEYLSSQENEERDAVIVAATVGALRKDDLVVGNVRVMKGTYFLKRRLNLSVAQFERQAAGPYDRALNHEIRSYARERSWIKETARNSGEHRIRGNVPASNFSQIDRLIRKYDLEDAISWLRKHFKGATRNWMECVATVDVAIEELSRKGQAITVEAIKADIASDSEWKPKLFKPHFADTEIKRAMRHLQKIFAE